MKAVEESYAVSIEIIKLAKELDKRKCFALSNQVIRSGTSVGANLREAESPESRKDLIHKLKVAQKEANETIYWLSLIEDSKKIDTIQIRDRLEIIQKIISKSIRTLHNNLECKKP